MGRTTLRVVGVGTDGGVREGVCMAAGDGSVKGLGSI